MRIGSFFQKGYCFVSTVTCLVELGEEAVRFRLRVAFLQRILKRPDGVLRLACVHVGIGLVDVGTRGVWLNGCRRIEVAGSHAILAFIIPGPVEGLQTTIELFLEGDAQLERDAFLVGRIVFNRFAERFQHVADRGDVLILVLCGKCLVLQNTALQLVSLGVLGVVFESRLQVAQRTIIVLVTKVEFGSFHIRVTGATIGSGEDHRTEKKGEK